MGVFTTKLNFVAGTALARSTRSLGGRCRCLLRPKSELWSGSSCSRRSL